MEPRRRVVVIDLIGLSLDHFRSPGLMPVIDSLLCEGSLRKMTPVFPALRHPAQASLTTGAYPERHGILGGGLFSRDNYEISCNADFASLVDVERIWDRLKRRNPALRSAAVFLHNTIYSSLDAVVAPQPFETGSGLCDWCYSKPTGLYEDIALAVGPFRLNTFRGPLASIESTRWIAKAAVEVMARTLPDLMFVCLPHLEFPSQKYGPGSEKVLEAVTAVDEEVGRIVEGVRGIPWEGDTVFVVLSEYAYHEVWEGISINRRLRDHGLLATRVIRGHEYLDLEDSPAFALVDHQVAHVYVKPQYRYDVRQVLEIAEGVDCVIDAATDRGVRVGHRRSGDFIAVSSSDRWFSYYWWDDPDLAPPFAGKAGGQGKPGCDPLELFIDPKTMRVPQATTFIKGSHGHPPVEDHDRVPLVISGADLPDVPEQVSVTDVASIIERLLNLPSLPRTDCEV